MASEQKMNVVGVFMDQLGLEQEYVSFRDAIPRHLYTTLQKRGTRVFLRDELAMPRCFDILRSPSLPPII